MRNRKGEKIEGSFNWVCINGLLNPGNIHNIPKCTDLLIWDSKHESFHRAWFSGSAGLWVIENQVTRYEYDKLPDFYSHYTLVPGPGDGS